MAAAIAFIPAMISPILKKHNGALALGYAVFRTIEAQVERVVKFRTNF